jgi:hypothetical protein
MKMLADIFARQGASEKAGDLYFLLSKMDPFDDALAALSKENKGSGKNDLFEILGISPVDKSPVVEPVLEEECETIVAEVSADETAGQAPAEAAQSEPAEKAVVKEETAVLEREDEIEHLTAVPAAPATAETDMSSRLSMMFNEGDEAAPAAEEPPVQAAAETKEPPVAAGHEQENLPESGTIEARIGNLFGGSEAPPLIVDESDGPPDVTEELVVDAVENIDELLSGIELSDIGAPDFHKKQSAEVPQEPPAMTGGTVSGDDVAERLSGLFSGSSPERAQVPPPVAVKPKITLPLPPPPPIQIISGQDVIERLSEYFPDRKEKRIEETRIDSLPVLKPQQQQPPAPTVLPTALPDAETVIISGSDIAQRLDEFFPPSPAPAAVPIDEKDKAADIPDHVLTSTLADIYCQQGQSQLALTIYRRLAKKDPGNERIMQRISEIEAIVAQGIEAAQAQEKQPGTMKKTRSQRVVVPEQEDRRPLAGVRIKKKPDLNWRKRSKES